MRNFSAALATCFFSLITTTAALAQPLQQLFADEWERGLRESPESATFYGDHRFDALWSDQSLAAIAKREAADRAALARLLAIDRSALSPADQLHHDTFRWLQQARVDRQRFREHLLPISHQGGPQQADTIAQVMRFRSSADYRRWLARMAALPTLIEQTITLMQAGMKAGLVPPRVLIVRVPEQIRRQLVPDATQSPFYRPFQTLPGAVPAAERHALQSEAQAIIKERLQPAFDKLLAFIETDYLPRTRTSVAASDRADGAAYYDFLARDYTTTELTAEQIHATGLKEVARLQAAMERVKREAGFNGTLKAFFEFLRSDPRFFKKTPTELIDAYRALSKRIDPELVKVFRTLPRLPYGLRAIPDNVAPDTTTAYYQPGAADGSRPGYYYVNLFKPEVRPLWEMMPLSLHEAVPGHHLQTSRAAELEGLPEFRKHAYFVAYGEGWALYAEKLGYDMGLYDDVYDRFGQLTYEMWRAVRLVVDTGLHAKGWSRQQAIDYFSAHAPKTEQDIVNEVDRYIGTPGQALAYKVGEMVISQLREKAEGELGASFDLRDFNDAVLATGSVPLQALRTRIEAWIGEQRRRP